MTAFTQHGFERAKERLGSNERMIERFIQNAELRGKKPEDFHTRRERDWLKAHGGCGCTAIIYNGYCIILTETNTCVTLYKVPSWFGKRGHYDGKARIRDVARYQRYRDVYPEAG